MIIFSLHKEFDMTNLGALNYFLGISVTHDTAWMFLSQKRYDIELLERAHMLNYSPTQTSVDTESKLGPEGTLISDPTLYRSLAGSSLVAYSDADWVGCPATRRSTFGYCVFLGNNLLSWSYNSRSSTEAEYRAFLIVVYLYANPVQRQRTKHIEIDIYFVRDMDAMGHVRVLHVPSRYEYADIFTKGLPSTLFDNFALV
nr:hypothetical protein [Tanacetum cinerariifolium]